jgi:hypothetical protein
MHKPKTWTACRSGPAMTIKAGGQKLTDVRKIEQSGAHIIATTGGGAEHILATVDAEA